MKNKEKFAKEIVEIACDRGTIAVREKDKHIVRCSKISCSNCLFENNERDCGELVRQWAESEYIENPVISKRDRTFLEYLKKCYKYIARDENGRLFAYKSKPNKLNINWNSNDSFGISDILNLSLNYNVEFPMIQWGDTEPWLIEDLKKLDVVEEYE